MKKLLILCFGVLVGLPAISQVLEVTKDGAGYKSIIFNPVTGQETVVPVDSTNFWKPGEIDPPDPPNPSVCACDLEVGSGKQYASIQAAALIAQTGQTVGVYAGAYRETITPANPGVKFIVCPGELVTISGYNFVSTPWVLHSGNIYKTQITLPSIVTDVTNSNTSLLAHQLYRNGSIQFEAGWPNFQNEADLFNVSKRRHVSQMVNFNETSLQDASIPSNVSGAKIIIHGWFTTKTRTVSSQSGTTINYSPAVGQGNYRYRKYYRLVGKLSLLDIAKEFAYEGGWLYYYQEGGGLPSSVEYKARNWGFDLRGKANTVIKGFQFVGCDPVVSDANSPNTIVDGIKSKYQNHSLTFASDDFPGYGNAKQVGLKLLGANSVIKNSELSYAASQSIWLSQGGRAENNLIHDIDYDGSWGSGLSFWGSSGNIVMTKNTMYRFGRSAIDMGYNYISGGVAQNLNIEISYNDLSQWGMLNIDLGAVYAWGFRNLTGSVYHHNWIHDSGVVPDPTKINLDGMQAGTYLDQASGPITAHHNVYWNTNLKFADGTNYGHGTSDHYTQPQFEHRNTGPSYLYNNTYASTPTPNSYITYVTNPLDVQKNNIYRGRVNVDWQAGNSGNVTNSVMDNTNPQFLLQGSGGLQYRLASGSPALNLGVAISGITTGSVGNPDAGAYERDGDPSVASWVPGYTPGEYSAENIDDTDPSNNKAGTWVTFNKPVFYNSTCSYSYTPSATISATFTGTGVEWWSEKAANHSIIRVKINGVTQDCDPVASGVQDCDLYANTTANNSQKIFSVTGLTAGAKTIELSIVGQNPAATENNIIHDYFKVIP